MTENKEQKSRELREALAWAMYRETWKADTPEEEILRGWQEQPVARAQARSSADSVISLFEAAGIGLKVTNSKKLQALIEDLITVKPRAAYVLGESVEVIKSTTEDQSENPPLP